MRDTRDKRDREKSGEDVAFGLEQTLLCFSTDFIDPYVGKWLQNRFGTAPRRATLRHLWGGELIGDSAAFFLFLGIRRFLPRPVEWLKGAARLWIEPLGEHVARERREAHGVPFTPQELDAWKDYQAENFAKSSIISLTSIATNVVAQKAMGNPHGVPIILAGKIVGASITTASMLGLRFAFPDSTRQLDREVSERYVSPVARKVQRWLGAESKEKNPRTHIERIHGGSQLSPLAR